MEEIIARVKYDKKQGYSPGVTARLRSNDADKLSEKLIKTYEGLVREYDGKIPPEEIARMKTNKSVLSAYLDPLSDINDDDEWLLIY